MVLWKTKPYVLGFSQLKSLVKNIPNFYDGITNPFSNVFNVFLFSVAPSQDGTTVGQKY